MTCVRNTLQSVIPSSRPHPSSSSILSLSDDAVNDAASDDISDVISDSDNDDHGSFSSGSIMEQWDDSPSSPKSQSNFWVLLPSPCRTPEVNIGFLPAVRSPEWNSHSRATLDVIIGRCADCLLPFQNPMPHPHICPYPRRFLSTYCCGSGPTHHRVQTLPPPVMTRLRPRTASPTRSMSPTAGPSGTRTACRRWQFTPLLSLVYWCDSLLLNLRDAK
jgi:hypothetical protein